MLHQRVGPLPTSEVESTTSRNDSGKLGKCYLSFTLETFKTFENNTKSSVLIKRLGYSSYRYRIELGK